MLIKKVSWPEANGNAHCSGYGIIYACQSSFSMWKNKIVKSKFGRKYSQWVAMCINKTSCRHLLLLLDKSPLASIFEKSFKICVYTWQMWAHPLYLRRSYIIAAAQVFLAIRIKKVNRIGEYRKIFKKKKNIYDF